MKIPKKEKSTMKQMMFSIIAAFLYVDYVRYCQKHGGSVLDTDVLKPLFSRISAIVAIYISLYYYSIYKRKG